MCDQLPHTNLCEGSRDGAHEECDISSLITNTSARLHQSPNSTIVGIELCRVVVRGHWVPDPHIIATVGEKERIKYVLRIIKARFTHLCVLWSLLAAAAGELLLPRLAAIWRRLGFIGLFVVETVGGPGAAVLPRGTRCTASFHGICGLSDEGKSLMFGAVSRAPRTGRHVLDCVRMCDIAKNFRVQSELSDLRLSREWLATLAAFRGK